MRGGTYAVTLENGGMAMKTKKVVVFVLLASVFAAVSFTEAAQLVQKKAEERVRVSDDKNPHSHRILGAEELRQKLTSRNDEKRFVFLVRRVEFRFPGVSAGYSASRIYGRMPTRGEVDAGINANINGKVVCGQGNEIVDIREILNQNLLAAGYLFPDCSSPAAESPDLYADVTVALLRLEERGRGRDYGFFSASSRFVGKLTFRVTISTFDKNGLSVPEMSATEVVVVEHFSQKQRFWSAIFVGDQKYDVEISLDPVAEAAAYALDYMLSVRK